MRNRRRFTMLIIVVVTAISTYIYYNVYDDVLMGTLGIALHQRQTKTSMLNSLRRINVLSKKPSSSTYREKSNQLNTTSQRLFGSISEGQQRMEQLKASYKVTTIRLMSEGSILDHNSNRSHPSPIKDFSSDDLNYSNRTYKKMRSESNSSIAKVPDTVMLYEAEKEMRERASQVMHRCTHSKLIKGSSSPKLNQYLATVKDKKYIYYPIAKCGWTTWMYLMFSAVGKGDIPSNKSFVWGWDSPYELANMKILKKVADTKAYKERLLFVRHPYDRLVSAYKNKALYGPYSHMLHTPCKWLKEGMPHITFPQFVECIVAKAKKIDRLDLSSKFVSNGLDIHWQPQYWNSLPCDTNYTLIGEFKHLSEDISGAVKVLQLNATAQHHNKGILHPNETLGFWYNQLNKDMKNSLKTIYQFDFEVFGYDSTIPS